MSPDKLLIHVYHMSSRVSSWF